MWHGHYYKYMEWARTALLRARELEVHQIVELGYRMFVMESKCRYHSPLRYADQARVTAQLRDVENRINVSYELFNVTTERRAARGHTLLVTTDAEGNLLMETPDAILARLCDA